MKLAIDPLMTGPSVKAQTNPKGDMTSSSENLRRTCETFEAIFTQQVFKTMRATVGEGGLLPKSQSDEIFADLMDRQVAQDLASSKRLGIADMLFSQLQPDES